jgi:Fe-S-cluster containining protein
MIEFAIAEYARGLLSACMDERPRRHVVADVVQSIAGFADQSSRQLEPVDGKVAHIACKAGCNHCCHMRVVATVPEVIGVAEFMASNFSAELFEATRRRVLDLETRGLSDEQWGVGHYPCPLLVNGKCSVYAARPLECRGYNSTSVEACRAAARDYLHWEVPMDNSLMSAFKSAQAGLLQALTCVGHPPRLVEMTAALRVIFLDQLAVERWLEGENSFAEAELDWSDPEQRAFLPWVPSDELRAADEVDDVE